MQIITGKQQMPQRVVVYGPEGIGKSTFASRFPKPVFIDTEGSTEQMDVARTQRPSSWSMLRAQVKSLATMDYQTIVIDTADWAERLCEDHVIGVAANPKIKSIEDFGYGKGYVIAAEEFGKFLNELDDIRQRGKNIVILAHTMMRRIELPDEQGAFDRYELKLSKKLSPMVKEWADLVLFANYKTLVVEVDGKFKAQGGRRVMYAAHHPCWDAKNRHGLPDENEFDFAVIAGLIPSQGQPQGQPALPAKTVLANPSGTRPDPKIDHEAMEREAIDNPAVTEPQATGTRIPFDFPAGFPVKLMELMQHDGITDEQVRKAVASRGYFPVETPIDRYPDAFVDGVLVSAWPKVVAMIRAM
jgi:hypothetical protein